MEPKIIMLWRKVLEKKIVSYQKHYVLVRDVFREII